MKIKNKIKSTVIDLDTIQHLYSSHPLSVQTTLHSNYPSIQEPNLAFLINPIEFQTTISTMFNNSVLWTKVLRVKQ